MVIAAAQEGKWKTSLQLWGSSPCWCTTSTRWILWVWQGPVNFNAVGQVLTYLSVVFSLWSAGVYFRGFLQMLGRRGDGSRNWPRPERPVLPGGEPAEAHGLEGRPLLGEDSAVWANASMLA